MRFKEPIKYDISLDRYKYLKREKNRFLHRVDINELNKRLNATNRSNFYTTTLFVVLCLSCLIALSLIGIIF
tara:strand:- start:597 stop:812 length:216 start_codon:yes stop_codon:yes gene_type:complete